MNIKAMREKLSTFYTEDYIRRMDDGKVSYIYIWLESRDRIEKEAYDEIVHN